MFLFKKKKKLKEYKSYAVEKSYLIYSTMSTFADGNRATCRRTRNQKLLIMVIIKLKQSENCLHSVCYLNKML